MKNLYVILIVFSICFLSCNKKVESTPQTDTNSQIKTTLKTKIKPSLISKVLKNDTLVSLSDISKLKEFENTELKIREIDTITLKPYELVYGTISYKTTQKYAGSGIIILNQKKSANKILWHYFDPSDFPPHTFSFIDFNGDGKKDLYMYLDQSIINDVYKTGRWNRMTFRARGNRLEYWLNGMKVMDFVDNDPKASRNGIIGFQLHDGSVMKAEFRNVRVLPLD